MLQIFDDDFIEFQLHDQDDLFRNRPRAVQRHRIDPFNIGDDEFIKKYRFSKDFVRNHIIPIACPLPDERLSNRGQPINPTLKVASALRYYATGSFQAVCGDVYGLSQPSVSRIVKQVSETLAAHLGDAVYFPRGEELNVVKQRFYDINGFPNVVGCVDCTHIPIVSPGGEYAERFRCRKGFFSLNVQLVTGPELQIFDSVIRWPGSTHDSRIFQNSSVRWRIENPEGDLNGSFLLGDSGYAQSKCLYTPVLNPETAAERRYNSSHKSTRNTVERAIGVLKKRFPCLMQKMRTEMRTSTRVVAACCVLHNIGRMYDPREFDEEYADNDWQRFVVDIPEARENERGRRIKEVFIRRHFSRV